MSHPLLGFSPDPDDFDDDSPEHTVYRFFDYLTLTLSVVISLLLLIYIFVPSAR